MPSFSLSGFIRKARRFWFSGEESLDLDASPAATGASAKVDEHAQSGSVSPGPTCMGMIRCKSMDNEKLARASSLGKQVKRQPSERKPTYRMPRLMGGRNKVQAFPADEGVAEPRRSAGTKAAIGAIRMNLVAAPPREETDENSLWRRRTQAEPPRLQID